MYREGVSCDIRCNCGYEFCFKCRATPHGTATCTHAKKWREMEKTIEDASKTFEDAVTLSDMMYLLEKRPSDILVARNRSREITVVIT